MNKSSAGLTVRKVLQIILSESKYEVQSQQPQPEPQLLFKLKISVNKMM